ncbi:excinuclease ABC subunit UvrA [endosymbiont 'TC1' of Trimyema compressum]|uniref:excinuclease ABC subunit UvrA n=1 Tax=endosymbiont 'TC1' of Trimyema compressum TaxID=243899 RepID=UPI000A49FC7A
MKDKIIIKGAKENNLKNIDIELPRDKMIVMTGVSGSGKTSLAFDTIYAEGQRRYVESLSSYARQFLGQMEKPDIESIEGLSPAISIDQKQGSRNPRSTVGTVTEIYDYLRLLYARIGDVFCPNCGAKISKQTISQMVDKVMALEEGTKLMILAPLVRGRKGEYIKLFEKLKKDGYVRVRVDGEMMETSEPIVLDKNKKHTIEAVIDRLIIKEGLERRLADSFEIALKLGEGIALVSIVDGEEMLFSENFVCLECGATIEEVEPRLFSFNSPFGSCPECTGLGFKQNFAEELIIPDPKLSINEGAINVGPWNSKSSEYYPAFLKRLANHFGFSLDEPFEKIPKKAREAILNGTKEKITFEYKPQSGRGWTFTKPFEGIIPKLRRRYRETNSEGIRQEIEGYMEIKDCEVCQGQRLRKEALSIYVDNKNIAELIAFSIEDALTFFNTLELSSRNEKIAYQILKEIKSRLTFLNNVGLNYLTLNRSATTLSGGEAQRIRLATQIGSGLVGVLYILDEPSIGLHQRDNTKLIEALMHLRDIGNTLIIVEHDEETMWASDVLVDIGPRAGKQGGEIVALGTPEKVAKTKGSITGEYLSGKRKIEVPVERRKGRDEYITIKGARENNLRKIDVSIPLGTMTCVTGVSGSGKSTLINDILYKSLGKTLNRRKERAGLHTSIEGIEHIDKIINIDQSPIGRTPRSNPATYTGTFDLIRELFASTKEAKARGYKAGRFSFNVKGGRCENCQGDGIIKIEMHFLPDVYVPCEVCGGERYNRETLDIKYRGKSIADILNMTIEEAYYFFGNLPRIKKKLETLIEVGLSYVQMGQPATTLSGGEAQRIKLASELSKRSTGKTMYILDEPTTGLHFFDIEKLLHVLQRLTDGGNTIVVIEHNLDVIKTADYILDLGPEGGTGGGLLIASGTPEEVAEVKGSYTGQYLKKVLGGSPYGGQNSK